MSVGISLSQLLVDNPEPLSSGIEALDECLGDGFQPRSIYEIYGPPGVGKTRLGLQLVEKSQGDVLWIETFKPMPFGQLSDTARETCMRSRCTKFTQLLYLFRSLLRAPEDQEKQADRQLVVVDGFSQLVSDHMYHLQARSSERNMHEIKCRHLTTMFTAMTKFTHSTKSTVILLDHCMNTSYQNGGSGTFDQDLDLVDDGCNFFVTSSTTKRVQVLRSALTASGVAMGSRDSRWEAFLDRRIALFWDWDKPTETNKQSPHQRPKRTRIALVTSTDSSGRSNSIAVPWQEWPSKEAPQRTDGSDGSGSAELDEIVWDSEG